MNFKVGKLYKYPEFYLFIYPTKEMAAAGLLVVFDAVALSSLDATVDWTNYLSRKLNCKVYYSQPGEIFMFLERHTKENDIFLHVLFGEKQGWIIYRDWLDIQTLADIA